MTGSSETRNSWLTIGKEYVVLAVSVLPEHGAMFRVIGDDGHTPALFEARQFAVTLADVPSAWKAQSTENGSLEFGPIPWLRRGFWEDYFNGLPDARADFEKAKAAIVNESMPNR